MSWTNAFYQALDPSLSNAAPNEAEAYTQPPRQSTMSSIGQAIHNTFSPKIILGRQDSDDPQRSKWKDPRVIIPLLAIVLLAVGGTIGGVVVGTRSDDEPSATPASSGNSSTTTDSVGTAEFTPPVSNKWYRIINEIGNDKRALHADNWDSIKALPIEDSNKQFWQFIPTSVNLSRIRNRGSSQPNRLRLLEDYYVGIENDLPSDNPMFNNLLWDFVEGKDTSKTTRVIVNLKSLDRAWLEYDASYRARMKFGEGPDSYWYIEEEAP